MKSRDIFNIVSTLIVILSYLSSIFFNYESAVNVVIAILILFTGFLWMIIINQPIDKKKLILLIFSIGIVFFTLRANLISIALILLLSIIADSNKCSISTKQYVVISVMCFLITIILYEVLGINKNCDGVIWRVVNQSVIKRASLGFKHPNQAMFKWFGIAIGLLLLRNKRNTYLILSTTFIFTLIIYKFTVSRTVFIIVSSIIFIMLVLKKYLDNKLSKMNKKLLGIIPIFFTILSFLSIKLSKYEYIDNLFSGRFSLFKKYFDESGLLLFGNKVIENNSMLDNSYIHMFLSKGIIFSVIYLIVIYSMIKNAKNITVSDGIIILLYFTAGLTETIFLKFDLIVLLIIILYRHQKDTKYKL